MIRRLTSVVIDIEQQVIPTLVVSHVSILQCLMAYFRNTSVEQCMSIDVPMHTIIEYTPVRGGGFSEERHTLDESIAATMTAATMQSVGSVASEISQMSMTHFGEEGKELPPIWTDGMPTAPVSPSPIRKTQQITKRGVTA